jgi:hypothetical protein
VSVVEQELDAARATLAGADAHQAPVAVEVAVAKMRSKHPQ